MTDFERDGLDLWRRYRAAAWPVAGSPSPADPAGSTPEPAATLLAAYLEHRLDEAEAAPVEAWLARNPDAITLLTEFSLSASSPPAPLELVRRARSLVAAPPRPAWRQAMAWASVAASLLIVGTTGFLAGHDAVDRSEAIATIVGGELVDGPGGGDGDGAVF
jgi:ferric-dicitrate binding protein FerR (iron transport regulator)